MSIVMTGDDQLAYQAVCESCKTTGPRVEWSLSKGWPAEAHAVVAAEAKLIGWVQVKPARDGGHFSTWLCPVCAAERRLDCYRSWLFCLCMLACDRDVDRAAVMFLRRCEQHGVPV